MKTQQLTWPVGAPLTSVSAWTSPGPACKGHCWYQWAGTFLPRRSIQRWDTDRSVLKSIFSWWTKIKIHSEVKKKRFKCLLLFSYWALQSKEWYKKRLWRDSKVTQSSPWRWKIIEAYSTVFRGSNILKEFSLTSPQWVLLRIPRPIRNTLLFWRDQTKVES